MLFFAKKIMQDSFRKTTDTALKKRATPAAVLAGIFGIFALATSYSGTQVSVYQWLLTLLLAGLGAGVYFFLDIGKADIRVKAACVFLLYSAAAYAVFYPTICNVFRSDYWLIAVLFHDGYAHPSLEAVKKIAFFEMFGNIRFQPLAHLLMFARFLVLGNNVILYNVLNLALHTAVAFFIFLILLDLTEDAGFSSLFGLLFIALPSQFDAVPWNYHVYIIAGTLFALASYLLARRFAKTDKVSYLAGAAVIALLSVFLYEPALLVPASLFLIIPGRRSSGGGSRRRILLVIFIIAAAYMAYLGFTFYGFTLTRAKHTMSLTDLILPVNIWRSALAVLINLWESTLIKNIGVIPFIEVRELVYVRLPDGVYSDFLSITRIITGLVIISMFRIDRKNSLTAFTLAAVALSYLLIISLGRMITNDQQYIITQPRYQYFANALMITAAGLLLWPKYTGQRSARMIITILLAGVFLWNTQNTLYGSGKVGGAMKPLDTQYYRIKGFLKEHRDAILLFDYSKENEKLSLGSDIALDVLFDGRVTRFTGKATHIYDGAAFKENPAYGKGAAQGRLADFTAGWVYSKSPRYLLRNAIGVVGPGNAYPKVSITPYGFLRVDLRNAATGNVDTYILEYPYAAEFSSSMAVEKEGGELCLIHNGVLYDKVRLDSAYKAWDKDGVDLMGDYYRGHGEPVWLSKFFFRSDAAIYRCADAVKGERLIPPTPAE